MYRYLQRRKVVTLTCLCRQLQHSDKHGGNKLTVRDVVLLDVAQIFFSIEVFHDDRSCPREHGCEVKAQGSCVVQRRR